MKFLVLLAVLLAVLAFDIGATYKIYRNNYEALREVLEAAKEEVELREVLEAAKEEVATRELAAEKKREDTSSSREFRDTALDVPQPPYTPEIVECQARKAVISWQPNEDGRSPILNYIVQYNTSFEPGAWEDAVTDVDAGTFFAEIPLSPWANYTFRVFARNELGDSEPSSISRVCSTPSDTPDKNPDNVKGAGNLPTNLIITWTPMTPIEQNGPDFYYTVKYRRQNSDMDPFWEVMQIRDATSSKLTIPNQETFVPYDIMVIAYNRNGRSKGKAIIYTGFSGEAMPSMTPANFGCSKPSSPKTTHCAWDKVPRRFINGKPEGYKIQWWDLEEGENSMREVEFSYNSTSGSILNLKPNSKIVLEIRVVNNRYESEPSPQIRIKTPENDTDGDGIPDPLDDDDDNDGIPDSEDYDADGNGIPDDGNRISVDIDWIPDVTPSTAYCSSGYFLCNNLNCTRNSWICDGDNDCGDWSDESNCSGNPTVAPTNEHCNFACRNGQCTWRSYVCDGDNDCGDWSDENNCFNTTDHTTVTPSNAHCSSGYFSCSNYRCIRNSWICDGDNDCGDLSDESNCLNTTDNTTVTPSNAYCSSGYFLCSNGNCTQNSWICDGDNDCGDWSDESNCLDECKSTTKGKEYRGLLSKTKSGITCQAWSSQSPHEHTRTSFRNPDSGLESNYCRNPDGEPLGPWCYTTNPRRRWEYCNIQVCQGLQPGLTPTPQDSGPQTRRQDACFHFPADSAQAYVKLFPLKHLELNAFTIDVSYYMIEGTMHPPIASYALVDDDNEILVETQGKMQVHHPGYSVMVNAGLEPKLKNETRLTFQWNGATGRMVVWENREKKVDEIVESAKTTVRPGGVFLLGQDQDSLEGGFARHQRFIGDICSFQMWDYVVDVPWLFEGTHAGGNVFDSPASYGYELKYGALRDECKSTTKGKEYRGLLSKTKSGITCQAWSSQSPHEHTRTSIRIRLDSGLESNYCRNPDGEPLGPWCYTSDPGRRWEYCNVQLCQGLEPGLIPTPQDSGPMTRRPGKCRIEERIDYWGNDFDNYYVNDREECEEKCMEQPRCRGYSYNNNEQRCWLKYKMENRQHHAATTSGVCEPEPEPRPEPQPKPEPEPEPEPVDPEADFTNSTDVEHVVASAMGVVDQLRGFGRNVVVFGLHMKSVLETGLAGYLIDLKPLVEATPPEVLKTLAINLMQTTKEELKSLSEVYLDYNPLHPKKTSDFLSSLRRELTTLSTFGQSVGELLDAADKFIVDYLDSLDSLRIEKIERRIDEGIKYLEEMPTEAFALLIFQELKAIETGRERESNDGTNENGGELVRLIDSATGRRTTKQGRLEVFHASSMHGDTWGTVCDDGYEGSGYPIDETQRNDNVAVVVCRMLGRTGGKVHNRAALGRGSGIILLDDLGCDGSENDLSDCTHGPWGLSNCGHDEDLGVTCD